ncbi:MAG: 4Fe-4S ferredoxin [Candidatus Omnitrophica bacterium CG07_land_8_20_14_0_80_42_15]|uniref:4Fe-4S ferredoxin n=1 Tax=Candidatus Aquitaenariimonas noxiae TaxID=1974741 RepID=A0A2J0KTL1_9BACT|nr:MAG: 4Fe-4S ferredoxin [Candidatus Omnitrophica bacterium CG07_land_8_20_14_0_80_42_15]
MRYPKLRELGEALRSLFFRPYTSSFPKVPHKPAERFRGKPEYFEKYCVGCLACEEVCPANTIEHEDITEGNKPIRRITLHLDVCQFCGNCQANCITEKGIQLTQKFELSTFDRKDATSVVEKELVLCQDCGEIIACKDHLVWIAEKIGPLAFSNPTLFLSKLKVLGIVDKDLGRTVIEGLTRGDRMKIICAKCRRKTTFED